MNPTIKKAFKTSFFSTLVYCALSAVCIFLGYSGFLSTLLLFPILLTVGLTYTGVTDIFFSGLLAFTAIWLVFFVIIVLCTFKIMKHENERKT